MSFSSQKIRFLSQVRITKLGSYCPIVSVRLQLAQSRLHSVALANFPLEVRGIWGCRAVACQEFIRKFPCLRMVPLEGPLTTTNMGRNFPRGHVGNLIPTFPTKEVCYCTLGPIRAQ